MKLYIPTCTLNFNNIFSSESISPTGFYSQREYGNRRFFPVCANNKEDAILLYSKFPRFTIDDRELENYSLVIEIDTNDYKPDFFEKAAEHDGVETYACYQTIYLNPFHSIIHFNSYLEKQSVLSKAEQSLENKFYKLYLAYCTIRAEREKSFPEKSSRSHEEKEEFTWNPSYANTKLKNISIDTKTDLAIDRIKGFLYCYLIGANNSVSREVGKLKALYRKLRNTLSAVVNSPDHRPTQTQDDIILDGIKEFNNIYSLIDEDTISNTTIIKGHLEDNHLHLSYDDARQLLEHWRLFDVFCVKLNLKKVYDASDLWRCFDNFSQESFNLVTGSMDSAIKRLEDKDISKSRKNAINSLVQIEEGLTVHIIDSSSLMDFYGILIQSLIKGEYKQVMDEKGVKEPLAQAYNGGLLLKNILGEKWDGSSYANYIQSLLKHFQDNGAFDLFATDNDVLISFAAFCQKGDDIDRLKEYIVQCGFTNYRLVYGLYGAARGFATLPKTFTSVLIDNDKEYYQMVSKTIWKMLNGVDITNATLPQPEVGAPHLQESPIGANIIKNIDDIVPKKGEQTKVMEAVSKAVELEYKVQCPKAFMYILDSITGIKKSNAYSALRKANFEDDDGDYTPEQFKDRIYQIVGEKNLKTQKDKIDRAIELEAERHNREAFMKILDNFLPSSDKSYKNIAKLLNEDTHKATVKTNSGTSKLKANNYATQGILKFSSPTNTSYFYNDPSTITELQTFIGEDVKEVLWFFNCLKDPKGSRRFYSDVDETNNKWVIDIFCKSDKIKCALGEKREEIRNHFYRKYGIRKDSYHN